MTIVGEARDISLNETCDTSQQIHTSRCSYQENTIFELKGCELCLCHEPTSDFTFWYPAEYNFLAPAKYACLRFSVLPSSSPMVGIVHSRKALTTLGPIAATKQANRAVTIIGHRLDTKSRGDCALPMVKDLSS